MGKKGFLTPLALTFFFTRLFANVSWWGMTKLFPLSLPGLLALEDGGRRCSFLRLVKRLLLSS